MSQNSQASETVATFNRKQQLYGRLFTGILIDLTVLNLFDEYWDLVVIESFTISLLTAILLQALLKITLQIEHRVAAFFQSRSGKYNKILRLLSTWAILFGSKFVILGAVEYTFRDAVVFSGPLHGIVAFIVVIVIMLVAEAAAHRFKKWLG